MYKQILIGNIMFQTRESPEKKQITFAFPKDSLSLSLSNFYFTLDLNGIYETLWKYLRFPSKNI